MIFSESVSLCNFGVSTCTYESTDYPGMFKVLRGPAVGAVVEVYSADVGAFKGDKVKASSISEYASQR